MFVPDVKEETKNHVQVRTSSEISEMVTFNKTGQAIQWVHAVDYEKLVEQIADAKRFVEQVLIEHNVTGAFIQNYEKQYGQDEWVNIAYVREILGTLPTQINSGNKSSEVSK